MSEKTDFSGLSIIFMLDLPKENAKNPTKISKKMKKMRKNPFGIKAF